MPLTVVRGGQRVNLSVTVGERPSEDELARLNGVDDDTPVKEPEQSQQSAGQKSTREGLGVAVQALTPEVARSLALNDASLRGVVVAAVDPSSDAASKGIQQGDIILSINRARPARPDEAAAAVSAARAAGRRSVLLLVRRGNAPAGYLGVELTRPPPTDRPRLLIACRPCPSRIGATWLAGVA